MAFQTDISFASVGSYPSSLETVNKNIPRPSSPSKSGEIGARFLLVALVFSLVALVACSSPLVHARFRDYLAVEVLLDDLERFISKQCLIMTKDIVSVGVQLDSDPGKQ